MERFEKGGRWESALLFKICNQNLYIIFIDSLLNAVQYLLRSMELLFYFYLFPIANVLSVWFHVQILLYCASKPKLLVTCLQAGINLVTIMHLMLGQHVYSLSVIQVVHMISIPFQLALLTLMEINLAWLDLQSKRSWVDLQPIYHFLHDLSRNLSWPESLQSTSLQSNWKKLHSRILQVVAAEVQFFQSRSLRAESRGQSFTALLWQCAVTQPAQLLFWP